MNSTTTAVLHTPAQINAFRAQMLRVGLESEIKGMRLTSKGRTCYAMIKSELGFKGNRKRVYGQYVLWMEQKGLLVIEDNMRLLFQYMAVKG